jgi:hypothetical protein
VVKLKMGLTFFAIFSKKNFSEILQQSEMLAAHYNNIYLVARRRNMNSFCDLYLRVAFVSMYEVATGWTVFSIFVDILYV